MKKYIILSVVVIVFAICIAVLVMSRIGEMKKQQWVARCADYDPQWEDVFNCYGLISISGADDNTYLVEDNKEPGAIIAEIGNLDDFIVQDNQMYLIDVAPIVQCNGLMPGKYCGSFQVNGEPEAFYYNTPNEVPRYLIIDTQTGNERFYVQPQDASSSDASIFEQLMEKESNQSWYDKLLGHI